MIETNLGALCSLGKKKQRLRAQKRPSCFVKNCVPGCRVRDKTSYHIFLGKSFIPASAASLFVLVVGFFVCMFVFFTKFLMPVLKRPCQCQINSNCNSSVIAVCAFQMECSVLEHCVADKLANKSFDFCTSDTFNKISKGSQKAILIHKI